MLGAGLLLIGAEASARTRAIATQAAGTPRQARVLVLVIDDQTRVWAQRIVAGIHDVLMSAPNPPALYIEGFDTSRFTAPSYSDDFRGGSRASIRIVPSTSSSPSARTR